MVQNIRFNNIFTFTLLILIIFIISTAEAESNSKSFDITNKANFGTSSLTHINAVSIQSSASSNVILSNPKLSLTVYPGGGFTGSTFDGKWIFFPGDTSMVSIKIGSKEYDLNHYGDNLTKATYINPSNSNEAITIWDLPENIHVEQHIELVGEYARFSLEVKNNNVASQTVSARYLWDTQLADNDGSPLLEEGGVTPRQFEQGFSPVSFNWWSAYDRPEQSTLVTYSTWDSSSIPTKIIFAHWPKAIGTVYNYNWVSTIRFYTPGYVTSPQSDSSVLTYWDSMVLDAGESKKLSLTYGTTKNIGFQLQIKTNKNEYGVNEKMDITADVFTQNSVIQLSKNDFSVYINNQKIPSNNYSWELIGPGKYKITKLQVPNSIGNHQVEVRVVTGTGSASDTKIISVKDYFTYKVLFILASPRDVWDATNNRPTLNWPAGSQTDWYASHGSPNWYKSLVQELHDYYWRITYNKINLDVTVTDRWYELPGRTGDNGYPGISEINDAETLASKDYNLGLYDIHVIVDPTSFEDNRFAWNNILGSTYANQHGDIILGTLYVLSANPEIGMVKLIAHEISHKYDSLHNGRFTIDAKHGDNLDSFYSIMGPMTDYGLVIRDWNIVKDWRGYEAPFDPINANKLGLSRFTEVTPPSGIFSSHSETLYPIEKGKDRPIHIQKNTNHYWVEFRDNSWPYERGERAVLVWHGNGTNWDHPNVDGVITSDLPLLRLYYDWNTHLHLRAMSISDTSSTIDVKYLTDVLTIAKRLEGTNYSINISLIGNFFENQPYGFSVIDALSQNEVYNSTLVTNNTGIFESQVSFMGNVPDYVENHPYVLRLLSGSGWLPIHISYPTILDGISEERSLLSINDPVETNTPGDIIRFNVSSGGIKFSLQTAQPVDLGSYKYTIYLDSDNSSNTGFSINGIGADYKIEYAENGANLFEYNNTWVKLNTPNILGANNKNNIEILASTEDIGNPDTIKLVAATYDNSNSLIDVAPDTTSEQKYIEFVNVRPLDLRLTKHDYEAGDIVRVNGYGFPPNKNIPIALLNSTNGVIWNGTIQADQNGIIDAISTWTVTSDFEGKVKVYWAGVSFDSFNIVRTKTIEFMLESNVNAPNIVGVDKQFEVNLSLLNAGERLTNLTIELNTSGKTSAPEIKSLSSLSTSEYYNSTWMLIAKEEGFAVITVKVYSNESTYISDPIGIYITNISVELNLPKSTVQKGDKVYFDVAVTNNQESVTYTNLKMETSIKNTDVSFSYPILALSPMNTVSSSYSWETKDAVPGIYQIVTDIIGDEKVLVSSEQDFKVEIYDAIPPTTNLILSGTLGNNNWYTSNVQVNLTATDNEGGSGINNTKYSFDNTTWNIYINPFNITSEGTTTLYYYSTDNSSNVEPTKNQTIKIDKTQSDILSYYRSLGSNPNTVETTDLLKAADDWSNNVAPPGFASPITTQQLLALADEWSGGE